MKYYEKIFVGILTIFLLAIIIAKPISSATGCVEKEVNISGISSFFYNGSLLNIGFVNITAVEKQDRGNTSTISNGQWSVKFNACTDNVEFITARISDNSNNIGFNELKIFSNNVSTSAITCTQQTITVSGYAISLNTGSPMTGGKLRGSIHDTIYTNATTFSGDIWEVKIDSCLNSGRIYTVSVLVSDNADTIRGEYYTKYAAR